MKRFIYLVTILLVACSGGGDSDDNTTMSKEFINTIQEVEILGDGGSQQFDIKSNCSWSISKSAEWLGVTPTSGTNNETSMDGFLSFCFPPFVFKRCTAFFVRISIGVNADTMIKRLRKTMVVKINALVGPYKYIPGTWVSLAVTNKKN